MDKEHGSGRTENGENGTEGQIEEDQLENSLQTTVELPGQAKCIASKTWRLEHNLKNQEGKTI